MKIFLTGASGFVGRTALPKLVAAGHQVRAMSRRADSDQAILAAGAEAVRCSLSDVTADHLGDHVDAVIHSAAYVEDWGPREAFEDINVGGTRRMLEVARSAGVRRFVHIGTEAALVHGQDLQGVDETYPLAPDSSYPYCATKARAEILVREANDDALETIVLRPRFIWGPGDTTLLPQIERMAKTKHWRWVDGGRARTSTTHVDNLVHAIQLALTDGTPGEAYFILDDGEITLREMITRLAATRHIHLPDRTIPAWTASALAWTAETVWRALGRSGRPPVTRHGAMVLARTCTLNGGKARREFGYQPVVSREAGLDAMT